MSVGRYSKIIKEIKFINIELLQIRKLIFFVLLICFSGAMVYFINYSFYTEQIFFNTYSDQLAFERIEKIFNAQERNKWIGYLLLPLLLYVKVLYNTCAVTTGSLLSDSRAGFKSNFNVCLKAEYVFVIMLFVKFLALSFFKEVDTLDDLSFMPGSLANLYKVTELPKWAVYPLQTINIWEILFCWVGTTLYALQFDVSKAMAFQRFCIPYLIGLFIWILVVVFITLQFS